MWNFLNKVLYPDLVAEVESEQRSEGYADYCLNQEKSRQEQNLNRPVVKYCGYKFDEDLWCTSLDCLCQWLCPSGYICLEELVPSRTCTRVTIPEITRNRHIPLKEGESFDRLICKNSCTMWKSAGTGRFKYQDGSLQLERVTQTTDPSICY